MNSYIRIIILNFFFISNLFAISHLDNLSYINTENITYDSKNEKVFFGNNSLINLNESNMILNGGYIDYKNDLIESNSKFYLSKNEMVLSGSKLIGNLELTKFQIDEINFLYNDELKIEAEILKRVDNKFYFQNGYLTPCALKGMYGCPTWSIKIKKTEYDLVEDKFTHYDSVLQIADKNLLYFPYFTHYGNKAPRKKGFLTPSFNIGIAGSNTSIKTPYYIPINESSDLTIIPKIPLTDELIQSREIFELQSVYDLKTSGGDTSIVTDTSFNTDNSELFNSVKLNINRVIDKNNNFELNSLYTNSISKSRSRNIDQISFENAYLRLNTYNFLKKDDFLISEVNTVTSFDETNSSFIPYQIPSIRYRNYININEKTNLYNDLNFYILRRDKSDNSSSSENITINFNNLFASKNSIKNINFINNFRIKNNYKKISFNNNSLNDEYINNSLIYSLEAINSSKYLKSRVKMTTHKNLNYKNTYNEDSRSLTFNYYNLFQDNRFFGSDLDDTSTRAAYGVEISKYFKEKNYNLAIGQSYDFLKGKEYLKKINQEEKFSDIAIHANMDLPNYSFSVDSRLSNKKFSKKEMNYYISIKQPYNLILNYNETSKNAYLTNSDDSKSLEVHLKKNISENVIFNFNTNLDLKNNYQPYENRITLNILDECSDLEISYINLRYSDNFNTNPNETIGLTFKMDYIGYLNYQKTTNLFDQ